MKHYLIEFENGTSTTGYFRSYEEAYDFASLISLGFDFSIWKID